MDKTANDTRFIKFYIQHAISKNTSLVNVFIPFILQDQVVDLTPGFQQNMTLNVATTGWIYGEPPQILTLWLPARVHT